MGKSTKSGSWNVNICIDCRRATGGCRWSLELKPVKGWTAKPVVRPDFITFHVTACPEFVPDEGYQPGKSTGGRVYHTNRRILVITETGERLYFRSAADASRWIVENGFSKTKNPTTVMGHISKANQEMGWTGKPFKAYGLELCFVKS